MGRMAQRRWAVGPDMQIETHTYGPVAVVSRDRQVDAAIDLVALLDRAGGVGSVVVGRHPTDLPGEMVTTGMVFEWRDRTDAKPQPERPVEAVPVQPPVTAQEDEAFEEIPGQTTLEEQLEAEDDSAFVEATS